MKDKFVRLRLSEDEMTDLEMLVFIEGGNKSSIIRKLISEKIEEYIADETIIPLTNETVSIKSRKEIRKIKE